jgi:uncharacterized metal-binding protein YceD (DUF177 family)
MSRISAPAAEFTRVVSTARLTGTACHHIEANEEERARLAERFGLIALPSFAADVELRRLAGGRVRLDATLRAEVVQPCVVTLEPVPGTVEEAFTLVYAPDAPEVIEDVLVSGDEEIVAPLVGESIDIGEAAAQELSLALDPFPRADGAALPAAEPETAAEAAETGRSPFAALAKLRRPAPE